jgi:hypothetical protein
LRIAGDQVLDNLSFSGAEVSDSIFGLCMMIIGILVLGVAILH